MPPNGGTARLLAKTAEVEFLKLEIGDSTKHDFMSKNLRAIFPKMHLLLSFKELDASSDAPP